MEDKIKSWNKLQDKTKYFQLCLQMRPVFHKDTRCLSRSTDKSKFMEKVLN